MSEQNPNWEDLRNKAKASADESFDESAFDDAKKKNKKSSTRQEKTENKEDKEREASIEKLLNFYRKIISASHPKEIFKLIDTSFPPEKQLDALKRSKNSLLKEFHQNNFNSERSANPFSKEISTIASNVNKLLEAFHNEAVDRIKGVSYVKTENSRRSMQNHYKATMDADVETAKKAEADLNGAKNEQAKGEEESEKQEQAQEKEQGQEHAEESDGGQEKTSETNGNENSREEANSQTGSNNESKGAESESGSASERNETGSEETNKENPDESKEAKKDPLEEALISARKLYAETEYKDRSAFEQLKKFSKFNFAKDQETPNISSAENIYKEALRAHMDQKVSELEQSGLEGEALKAKMRELHTYYNVTAAQELYNARTEAKFNSLRETENRTAFKRTWDKASLTMNRIAEWYNKEVPFYVKGGLSVAGFLAGAGVFSSGKRIWGAIMLATSGGMALDSASQMVDKYFGSKRSKKNVNESVDETGSADFEKFKSFLDKEIENADKKLNQNVMRSYLNKGVAVGLAAIMGSMAFSSGANAIENMKAENPVGSHANINVPKTDGSKLPPIPKTGIFADGPAPDGGDHTDKFNRITPSGGTPINPVDKFDHVTPSGAMNEVEQAAHVKEMAAEATKIETVSIKEPIRIHEGGKMRHDSFIRSLKDHLKNHPGIDKDEAGHIAEVTFHDAAKEYASSHGISYDEAFAKLSKIHPGTTYELKWDSQGHPHVVLDDKNIKFVHSNGHHASTVHADNYHGVKTEVAPLPDSDVPNNETYKEWNKEVIDAANKVNQEKYDIASAVTRGELPGLDPNSPNFQDNLRYATTLKNAAASDLYNWGPSYEVGRLGEIIKESQVHMKSLLDMPDKETFTKIGKDFFDNKKSNILKFGSMKVQDALNDPNKLDGLSEKAKKLIVGYANSDATKPKPNETFKVWSYRIMTLARKVAEKKVANADYDPTGL